MTMSSRPKTIPDGYATVTPWIILRGVEKFIAFITDTLGAKELARVYNADGTIGHAEARIGDATVMMFDSFQGWPETPQFLRLYVEDCQAICDRMIRTASSSKLRSIVGREPGNSPRLWRRTRLLRVCSPSLVSSNATPRSCA